MEYSLEDAALARIPYHSFYDPAQTVNNSARVLFDLCITWTRCIHIFATRPFVYLFAILSLGAQLLHYVLATYNGLEISISPLWHTAALGSVC